MFVKQWEEKTTVSYISFQCTSFEITKKCICLLKIADTSFKGKIFLPETIPKKLSVIKQTKFFLIQDHSVQKETSESGIPFVNTYSPKVKELGKFILGILLKEMYGAECVECLVSIL